MDNHYKFIIHTTYNSEYKTEHIMESNGLAYFEISVKDDTNYALVRNFSVDITELYSSLTDEMIKFIESQYYTSERFIVLEINKSLSDLRHDILSCNGYQFFSKQGENMIYNKFNKK